MLNTVVLIFGVWLIIFKPPFSVLFCIILTAIELTAEYDNIQLLALILRNELQPDISSVEILVLLHRNVDKVEILVNPISVDKRVFV